MALPKSRIAATTPTRAAGTGRTGPGGRAPGKWPKAQGSKARECGFAAAVDAEVHIGGVAAMAAWAVNPVHCQIPLHSAGVRLLSCRHPSITQLRCRKPPVEFTSRLDEECAPSWRCDASSDSPSAEAARIRSHHIHPPTEPLRSTRRDPGRSSGSPWNWMEAGCLW